MQPVEEDSGRTETLNLAERYRRGDEDAARLLFDRYVQRLLELAGSNLPPGVARRFGPEDVVQSVFRSLFRAVKEDRVKLERSGDLWAWLLQVTFNKLRGRSAYHLAAKRSVKREELPMAENTRDHPALAFWSKEPSVEHLAAIADELDYLFGPNGSPLRRVVDLRLQGFSMEEIGERLGTSHATVSRQLKKIGRRFEERLRNQSDACPCAEAAHQ
jgi:RNA polymerase sigma factor (sigma-70 family)